MSDTNFGHFSGEYVETRSYAVNENYIEVAQQRLDRFCEQQCAPKVAVQAIFVKEKVRILHAIVKPYWELDILRGAGLPLTIERREAHPMIRELARKYLWPLREKQYRQPVSYSNYQFIHLNEQYHIFTVTLFEDAIYPEENIAFKRIEERAGGLLAKKLRKLLGRGPKKTKAMFMNDQVAVYLVNGLLSPGNKNFIEKSIENAIHIERFFENNIQEAIDSIHTGSKETRKKIVMIDLDADLIVAIVFFNEGFELSEELLCR